MCGNTKPHFVSLILGLLTFGSLFSAFGQNQNATTYKTGELFIEFSPRASEKLKSFDDGRKKGLAEYPQLQRAFGKAKAQTFKKAFTHVDHKLINHIYHLSFSDTLATNNLLETLNDLPYITYAERIPQYEIIFQPNDPNAGLWHLSKINAQNAWDIEKGDAQVAVAITDNAIDINHPDLQGAIWTNQAEIPNNGQDDDNNGYVDDVNGYDVADGDNDPNPPVNTFAFSHGTHCSGIASANTDNSTGVSAIGFNTSIMPVKITSDNTNGNAITNGYAGIEYAINSGADIISMSWGGSGSSQTYQQLINAGHQMGIVFIAAAGNSNTSITHYPAGYNHVIAVGATGQNDNKASFSNYGQWIDVIAPGVGIYSPVVTSAQYDNMSGTSMACPMVSGIASLML